MSQQTSGPESPEMQGTAPPPMAVPVADAKYLIVVGALMVLIIFLLAWLWLRERRDAANARAVLAIARHSVDTQGLQTALGRMLGEQGALRPFQREDLPAETVQWNGQPRIALRVSAAAGIRLGLLPGDVLVVSQPPASASAPASAPATRPLTAEPQTTLR